MMIPIYPAQPMICLGILYGFLTIFCVTPSQIICARAFLIKDDSAGSIALIGSFIGQLCLVLLILSPFGVIWNRCYFGFLLTSIWFLWRAQKQFKLRSLKYESSSQFSFNSKFVLFTDSLIFQLLNPIALPNSICYRILTPILFRYSSHLIFVMSLIVGFIISNFFFVQLTRNLRSRIQYDALKTYQFIIPSLNNIFVNFVWSIIFLSLSRFTWGSYQDAFIKKDGWYHPLRLEKLRLKTRTSDCFFDNFIITDKRNKIFSTYLPKWSNLINGIENYTSFRKVNLVEKYDNESKTLENDIQEYNYYENDSEKYRKKITQKQKASVITKVVMTQLPRKRKNDFIFSWNITKIDSPNYVRRDLSLFRPKRSFNYIGYIQKWLSNNWNQDIKQVLFLPFSWEPLTYDECNEVLFLLHSSNKKLIQMLANPKLKDRLLKYKENTIKDLPGTPLASKRHNHKLQKWQEELEFLPLKVGIRKLKLLRFYTQKQRQEDLSKKFKINFRRNLTKLEPYYTQQAFFYTLLKRNIAIDKLKKEYQSMISPKQLSTYNKEGIKIKKRNKRPKGTLKAKLRKKHENRYFAPFRYFYMFQVNKVRDNLIKRRDNQLSKGVSLLTVLSEQDKRWLTGAQKSLHIRDLRKQQLKKQRDIAYKKSPFRWLANFVYTSNALLFLKLRKPILWGKAALKGAICFLLRKDFSFQEEIKDLDDSLYLIYDVEGNLMPSGKLPEWWFIHGFTVKRKFKDKKMEDIKKNFPSKEKKEIEDSSSDQFVQNNNLKVSRKMVLNNADSKKELEFSIFEINSKNAKSVNDKMILLKNNRISSNRKINLLTFSLVRVILFLEFQIIEIKKLFFSFIIISLRDCNNIPVYIKLLILKIRQIPNVLHIKKLFFLRFSFQPIQKFTIKKLILFCGNIYVKIKSLTFFNQLSSNLYTWNFFNKNILLFFRNLIDTILNLCFENVYISSLKKIFFKENFILSFSYINFAERISRSMLIFRFDSNFRRKEFSIKNSFPAFFSEKEKGIESFITVNKIESRFDSFLKDLENYHRFLTHLQKTLKFQTNYFHVLINNYFKEIYSLNRKNIQFPVNSQHINPIRVITKGKISTISFQKKTEFNKLLKNLQLSNTNRFLESWLFYCTKDNNNFEEKIEQEVARIFCKIQKRETKRRKVIEEYLYYLYSFIFSFKGDWKKLLNNFISLDSSEYKIRFFQRDLTNINEWSIFSFYNEKIQPLNYINDKKNSSEIIKDALMRMEPNNFNLFYLLASKKTSVQASSFHPVFFNLNNNVNGFLGKHSSVLENLEQSSLLSLNKNKILEKSIKGIDDQSLQKMKIDLHLSHHVFHCLFLEDSSNFYYNILPYLIIFHSVCSKNQFYHFWNKNRIILNKINKLSHRKRLFQFSTIVNDYLSPNYRIEDLVCMERVWFTNGKRYSTRRIFTDPWISDRPPNLQNLMWIYKDPFFYKT